MTDVTNSQAGIVITELDEAENAALGGAAMIDQFSNAMAFVERPDFDGQGPHCSPNDPGAWTNHGVTFATWAAWQTLHGAVKSLDLFKSLQLADFYPLYRSMFWNSCQCGNMGAIGIQVFDVAVGSGPGTAGQFVQHVLRAVGSTYDGNAVVGPVMVAALMACDPAVINAAFCTERERFYATLPTARYFERGWDRRAEACRDLVAGVLNSATNGVMTT